MLFGDRDDTESPQGLGVGSFVSEGRVDWPILSSVFPRYSDEYTPSCNFLICLLTDPGSVNKLGQCGRGCFTNSLVIN